MSRARAPTGDGGTATNECFRRRLLTGNSRRSTPTPCRARNRLKRFEDRHEPAACQPSPARAGGGPHVRPRHSTPPTRTRPGAATRRHLQGTTAATRTTSAGRPVGVTPAHRLRLATSPTSPLRPSYPGDDRPGGASATAQRAQATDPDLTRNNLTRRILKINLEAGKPGHMICSGPTECCKHPAGPDASHSGCYGSRYP
jgi:hypothetical protein